MPGQRWFRTLVPGVLAALLAGCNPFSEAEPMMSEYLERLGRVLETPVMTPDELPSASIMPRRRDRVLEMPELELGMLDFLSLYGCELQFVVGEKASVMGRVMQPLNRLRYEVRFIRAAEDCLPDIDDDDELKTELGNAIESKRESLPIATWNAIWGTEELEKLFTLSKGYYPVGEGQAPVSDLVTDLQQLGTMVEGLQRESRSQPASDISLEGLGAIQQRWQAEYRAGQLINSARLLTAYLNAGTRVIRARLEDRPLCLNGKPNNQSDIVRNFFFSVYIEKVQPYMSDVSRARDSLIAGFAGLAASQSEQMPASFEGWYQRHLSQNAG
ncbi:MAG: hypothetical protein B7X58_03145, partial [Marinobacter sp. 34-60-7]